MIDRRLTKSERFIVNEVDSMPEKIVRMNILRLSVRNTPGRPLTDAGFRRIVRKLVDRNLLARVDDKVTITFGGMQVLREPV